MRPVLVLPKSSPEVHRAARRFERALERRSDAEATRRRFIDGEAIHAAYQYARRAR